MAYLTQFGTATTSNTNLNTTTLIGTFTNTTRIRKLYLNIFADQVKGNGDYKASITVQRAGAGSFYQSIITTNTAAAGVTSILFNSIAVTLNATDVMKVYLLGLSTDNDTTADVIVDVNEEWLNTDASGNITVGDYASGKVPLQPTTAGRTLDVTTTGEAGLDFDNIHDATGAHTLTNITVPIVTTASAVTGLTAANLDTTISSRMATFVYTTPPTAIAISDQVWDEAIASHLAAGSTGAALNTAGAASDPLLNPVPGTYAAGTAGAALGSITTGHITVTSPMSQDGLAVKLIRGDDYLNADGRALVWTDSGSQWPNLTGATVKFKWVTFSKTCTVIGAGGAHQQVSLDLTSAETDVLQNGYFDIEATLSNTHVVTLVIAGSLIIKDDV